MADTPYTIEYFVALGFEPGEAEGILQNWNRQEPQTFEEMRAGLQWERDAREALAARHFEGNPQTRK